MNPKPLLFDLETSPILAWVWDLWNQNIGIPQIVRDSHIMTWSAKWMGDDEVMYDALPHYPLYKKEPFNDIHIVESMWELLDEAEIVIAQNGLKFDVPKINAAFLRHGILPPSPYKVIDTLKIAKQSFRLTSNKLDWMAKVLFNEGKIKTDFDLWARCLAGDKAAWEEMIDYNCKDVTMLEDVYIELRPWARSHPNMGLYVDDDDPMCPHCQSKNVIANGTRTSKTDAGKYRQFHCKDCGAYPRGRKNLNTKEKQASLLARTL